jgi:tRNA A37 threonylcarbamoyladenosine dehydratase
MNASSPLEIDYARRFRGIERIYGKEGLARLQHAHVCVVGVGGVGSWAAEALARSAVGRITLIDLDNVSESNVNRQIHALDHTYGRAKVSVMAERMRAIHPACEIHEIEDFVSLDNVAELITPEFHWVLDCMDAFRVKAGLIAHCRRRKIRIVTVGAAGGVIDPLRIKVSDLRRTEQDPLLARTRQQLREQYGFSSNDRRSYSVPAVYSQESAVYPNGDGGICERPDPDSVQGGLYCGGLGSVVTVTASFGLVAASLVLNRLVYPKPFDAGVD